jgi:hypothetical protein
LLISSSPDVSTRIKIESEASSGLPGPAWINRNKIMPQPSSFADVE